MAEPGAEHYLKQLLARIHGDGGHYVEKHGLDRAAVVADRIVSELQARGDPKCVLGEPCKLHGYIHGGEAEELRARLTEYAEDIEDRHPRGKERRVGETVAQEIVSLLEAVDARDSVAFLETRAGRANNLSMDEEDRDDG